MNLHFGQGKERSFKNKLTVKRSVGFRQTQNTKIQRSNVTAEGVIRLKSFLILAASAVPDKEATEQNVFSTLHIFKCIVIL